MRKISKVDSSPLIIGIDASNIRLGGGITHLKEILANYDFDPTVIGKIIVWGSQKTLTQLPSQTWIKKIPIDDLNKGLIRRVTWQTFNLTSEARANKCNLLFVPGGSFLGRFRPFVSMSQNLLPFESVEVQRLWPKPRFFKLTFLRLIQAITFKCSQGVIFLTEYSKAKTLVAIGKLVVPAIIIPHGLNRIFTKSLKSSKDIGLYTSSAPLRILYASNIDVYKHQASVLLAVKHLVRKGYPIKISFIGPGQNKQIEKFTNSLKEADPIGLWSEYLGQVPYEEIHNYYENADLGIFASSCETFGITLLEKMASGLPIACSNMSCMPEILQDGGLYFNPEDPSSIADAIEQYLLNPRLRVEKSLRSIELARNYSWEKCAQSTFSFLEKIAREYKK